MQIIDSQIHLWPSDTGPPHHWRKPFSVESAIEEMREAGIDAAINHPPFWDPESDAYASEAVAKYPSKFATLGWFPIDDKAGPERVDEWLKKPGMFGLRYIISVPAIDDAIRQGHFDWLWDAANTREIPMGLFAAPEQLELVGELAARFPKMRILLDHLSVSPDKKIPEATDHFDALAELAIHDNVAVKASAAPSMAIDNYPFKSTHSPVRQIFNAYGAERTFWGSDYTRINCSWRECVEHFTGEMSWLTGRELELVMGDALCNWIGWKRD